MVTGGRNDTDLLSSTESFIVGQSLSWKIETTLNLPFARRHLYGVSFLNRIIMTGTTFNPITLGIRTSEQYLFSTVSLNGFLKI